MPPKKVLLKQWTIELSYNGDEDVKQGTILGSLTKLQTLNTELTYDPTSLSLTI